MENVLQEKDGPSRVLKVVYTDGQALDFLMLMTMIGGLTTKGEQNTCEPAHVAHTEARASARAGTILSERTRLDTEAWRVSRTQSNSRRS